MNLKAAVEYRGAMSSVGFTDFGRAIDETCDHQHLVVHTDSCCSSTPVDIDHVNQIESVLALLRPAMEADGGGIEMVSYINGEVAVRLVGMCLACPSAALTMKHGVERTLIDRLPWIRAVVRVA